MSSDSKTSWVISSSSVSKPWGEETSWSSPNGVCVKTLRLDKGKRNSFKFNKIKDELLICAAGHVRAYHADENLVSESIGDLKVSEVHEGMALAVQSGCPYRLEAVEDSIILEVSTHRTTSGDGIVRLHDDHDREITQVSSHIDGIIKKWFLI